MKLQALQRMRRVANRRYVSRRIYIIDALVVLAIVASIGYAVFGNRGPQANPYDCEKVGEQHRLQLVGDAFSQPSLTINRCDTLTIENRDTLSYSLNFGKYNQHIDYAGYKATTLLPNESVTIDAFQAGRYELHDHFRDNAVLTLDIKEPRSLD